MNLPTPRHFKAALFTLVFFVSSCTVGAIGPQVPASPSLANPATAQPVGVTATPFEPELPTSTYLPSPFPTETSLPTSTLTPTAVPEPEVTLLFTGVIVPARCVQSSIDARGDANYLFAEVKDLISEADLAVGTLNASISDSQPHTGCVVTYVLVGDSRSAVAMGEAGFDLMSVATNHIKNMSLTGSGDQPFFDTLDNLRANGITPFGAGKNLEEALQPVVVEVQGIRFGFVSLGMIEPNAFAGEDRAGIAVLNDENLKAAIAAARDVSDFVIAMPHWGPEDSPDPTLVQLTLGRTAVEAGADLVVGNHTHVVQAIQEINGIPVFYGLGNFVFDQNWALDHQQGVILRVTFKGKTVDRYELIPTHVDFDGTVHIAGADEAAEILERIRIASEAIR